MDQEPRVDPSPREGEILAGKYRIEKVLGVGGMGVVVAAQHLDLEDRVAIKFLLPEATSNEEVLARFAREARAAVKIKSEHVARVSDVGTLDTGAPYMVMEYLEGGDLTAWLAEQGPLSVGQATEFVLQASEAIAEAHSIGIVHRDLKPANLFVIRRRDGKLAVKVLDFGISKVSGSSASGRDKGLTKTTSLMGTPLYMAPEQMESARNANACSDIWALGAILYELVTGEPPFNGETMPELCNHVMRHPPAPMAQYRPGLPEGFEAVVLKCLEKDPKQRYQNAADFAAALSPYAPVSARVSVERISNVLQAAGMATGLSLSRPAEAVTGLEKTAATWGSTAPVKPRGGLRSLIVVGAVVAVGVVATLVYVAERENAHTAQAAESALAATRAVPATAAPTPAPESSSSATAEASASAPIVTAAEAPSASAAVPPSHVHHPGKPVRHKPVTAHRVIHHKARAPKPKATSDVYSDRK